MGITAQGRALIARTKNGEQLTFTKIKIGTGVLPGGETEASRTSLVNFLKDVPITSVYLKTSEQFNIKVLFSNEGITEAKKITEQGIYAKIGNEAEVLYAYFYLVDGFINLPVPTGDRYLKSVKEFGLKTSDTGNAQVIIDGLIVHPTIEDMNRELAKKINNSEKTTTGEVDKIPVFSALGKLKGMFETIRERNFFGLPNTRYNKLFLDGIAIPISSIVDTYGTPFDTGIFVEDRNFRVIFKGVLQGNNSGGSQGLNSSVIEFTKDNNEFSFDGFTIKIHVLSEKLNVSVKHTSINSGQLVFLGELECFNVGGDGHSETYFIESQSSSFLKKIFSKFISTEKLTIKGNLSEAVDVKNLSDESIFIVDTVNEVLKGKAADKKVDKNQIYTGITFEENSDDLVPSQKSTKSYVLNKISELINSAPEMLNSLNELASALGNDPNFSTTVLNILSSKLNIVDLLQKIKEIDGSGSGIDADFLDGLHSSQLVKQYNWISTIDSVNWVKVGKITGGYGLSNQIKLLIRGTSENNVINVNADILVNYYDGIYIQTLSGNYTQLKIKISKDDSGNFNVFLQKKTGVGDTNVSLCMTTTNDAIVETYSNKEISVDFTQHYKIHETAPGLVLDTTQLLEANSGFSKLPNGLILQWGIVYNLPIEAVVNVIFPISFQIANPFISVVPNNNDNIGYAGGERNAYLYNCSLNGFTTRLGNGIQIHSLRWFAIGW